MQRRVAAADAFTNRRRHLWDLGYRVTGSVTDADALLRDCFENAVAQQAGAGDEDVRVHLTRSAALLAMDMFRRRRHRHYTGSWLPSLIETGNAASVGPRPGDAPGRYDMAESGSVAFLRALEALDPRERLVFVMCDALGHDPFDVASTLEVGLAIVRASLSSARRVMEVYDVTHEAPTRDAQAQTGSALHLCLSHMQQHHAAALEKLCAPDVEATLDSAGEFVAPLGAIRGADRVSRLLVKFAEGAGPLEFAFRMLNAMPAALGTSRGRPRWARRFAFRIEARGGQLTAVQLILATAKLAAVRFD